MLLLSLTIPGEGGICVSLLISQSCVVFIACYGAEEGNDEPPHFLHLLSTPSSFAAVRRSMSCLGNRAEFLKYISDLQGI